MWTKFFVKVVAVSFVLSLIAVVDEVAGQEKVNFSVSASSRTLGYSPLWVAHRQGFFDQQGLDVQLVLTANRVDAALIAVPRSQSRRSQGCNSDCGGAGTVKAAVAESHQIHRSQLPPRSA